MNKLFSLACLILLTLISCEDKSDSKLDLLEGKWNGTEKHLYYTPTVTFYENGEYINTDVIEIPLPPIGYNSITRKITISGIFNLRKNIIEFVTSDVEENINSTVNITGNIGGSITFRETPELITPNNNPRIWEIISLTENQLKVKYILDTLTFERP